MSGVKARNLDLGGAAPFEHDFIPHGLSVVLGANHAGKTALGRAIVGLDATPPGSIWIDGVDVSRRSAVERSAGLVYQAFVNYPDWTVFDNIASPLTAARVSKAERSRRVHDLAARLHIDNLLDRLPGELSGGQQQRVALARAFAGRRRVLVMDEPFANLDYQLRQEFSLLLRDLVRGQATSEGAEGSRAPSSVGSGVSVIYLTTDSRDAFRLGDEVILLDGRTRLQSGTPVEVYERPVSLAAADLMSEPAVNRAPGSQPESAVLAVRPEHLSLVRNAADDLCFEAEVLLTETNGVETFLHCRVQELDWVARLPGVQPQQSGKRVRLYVGAGDLIRIPPDQRPVS